MDLHTCIEDKVHDSWFRAGHCPHFSHHEEVLQVLDRFLPESESEIKGKIQTNGQCKNHNCAPTQPHSLIPPPLHLAVDLAGWTLSQVVLLAIRILSSWRVTKPMYSLATRKVARSCFKRSTLLSVPAFLSCPFVELPKSSLDCFSAFTCILSSRVQYHGFPREILARSHSTTNTTGRSAAFSLRRPACCRRVGAFSWVIQSKTPGIVPTETVQFLSDFHEKAQPEVGSVLMMQGIRLLLALTAVACLPCALVGAWISSAQFPGL